MLTATRPTRNTFTQDYLMARQQMEPSEFGVRLDRETFIELMIEEFNAYTQGQLSLDELLLRPRSAMHFCETIRGKHAWFDLPDDVILRTIMNRRKNPEQ